MPLRCRYGILVGAFSLGQLIGNPFWGWYSNGNKYSTTLYWTICIRLFGNLMYTAGYIVPGDNENHGKVWFICVARLLVGFGAGSMAVCSAYVSGATTPNERAGGLAKLSASGGMGFIFGPLFGIAFAGLKAPEHADRLSFDLFTGPAYFASLGCIVNIWLLRKNFKEVRLNEMPSGQKGVELAMQDNDEDADDDTKFNADSTGLLPSQVANSKNQGRDMVAVYALLFMYFGNMFVLSVFETIQLPLTALQFNWTPSQADTWNGVISGLYGLQAVAFFILAKPVSIKFGERKTLAAGFFITALSQYLQIPMNPEPVTGSVTLYNTDYHLTSLEYCYCASAMPLLDAVLAFVSCVAGMPPCPYLSFFALPIVRGGGR